MRGIDRTLILDLADDLEHRRIPRLVEKWRRETAGGAVLPAWRMRREAGDALRDAWRHELEHGGRGKPNRQETKVLVAALRQIGRELDAALLAADVNAFPQLAGAAIRRHAAPARKR